MVAASGTQMCKCAYAHLHICIGYSRFEGTVISRSPTNYGSLPPPVLTGRGQGSHLLAIGAQVLPNPALVCRTDDVDYACIDPVQPTSGCLRFWFMRGWWLLAEMKSSG